jgi:hypothetical protein
MINADTVAAARIRREELWIKAQSWGAFSGLKERQSVRIYCLLQAGV